jgi:hypothetical protein
MDSSHHPAGRRRLATRPVMASEGTTVLSLTCHAHAKTGTSTIHNHRRAALLGVRVP